MAHSKVADLTIDEFRSLIREVVVQTLAEMLGDPDAGLELRDDFRTALEHSLASVQAGEKTIPAQDVAAKWGLA